MCHDDSAATVTFEVVFSESSSDILFEYADTVFGDDCYFQDAGSYATVGVQVSPWVGTMWSVNRPVAVSGSALLFTLGSSTPPNNPYPNIISVSPSSVPLDGPAFTMTVNGTGFVPQSVVTFLFDQPTTYVSSTQLTAEIPAQSIAQVFGSTYVSVTNPAPRRRTIQPVHSSDFYRSSDHCFHSSNIRDGWIFQLHPGDQWHRV